MIRRRWIRAILYRTNTTRTRLCCGKPSYIARSILQYLLSVVASNVHPPGWHIADTKYCRSYRILHWPSSTEDKRSTVSKVWHIMWCYYMWFWRKRVPKTLSARRGFYMLWVVKFPIHQCTDTLATLRVVHHTVSFSSPLGTPRLSTLDSSLRQLPGQRFPLLVWHKM